MSTSGQTDILEKRITELEKENRRLNETVEFLTRKLYGTSSEKASSLGIEGQIQQFKSCANSHQPSIIIDR